MFFLTSVGVWAQTPVALPATSPYSENFNTTPGASGTSYPAGWTSYDDGTIDNSMTVGTATSTAGANYNYGSRIGVLGSGSAFLPSTIVLALTNTTGKTALKISYDVIKIREQGRSNTFNLEISTTSATSGFTAVTGGAYASGTIAQGTTTPYENIDISGLDNKSSTVWLRWNYTEISGSGSRDGIALDNVVISYTTGSAPTVNITTAVTNITTTGASTGGNVSSNGGAALSAKGVVYSSTQSTPTLANSDETVITGTTTGTFTTTLSGLTPGTLYYYRAYATNTPGTGYGPTLTFRTASLPTVTTTAQSNVSTTSATAGGNVTALGTQGVQGSTATPSTVSAKGIVWALASSADPTITTNLGITDNGTGIGSFTSSLTDLALNTSYKYRAYATSPEGTAYGPIVTFSTLNIVAPTVTTETFSAQNDATVATASLKGGVTNNGGATIEQRGFIWNTSNANLAVGEETTVDDTDDTDAAFTTQISGLTPNTQYFYRAFARNSNATGYGTINNFYTHAATPGAPVVNNPTVNSLAVSNDAGGNPVATEYVIRILTPIGIRYVNSLGNVTDTEVWITGATLASQLVVTGLSAGTAYTFDVKARNASGIETPYSGTTTASTASPSTPYFTLVASELEFGQLCINTTSAPGHFTFQANNVPVGQQIAVYSLEGFTYSLTETGTYQNGLFFNNTGNAITVYVKFTPTLAQPYPAEVNGVPGTIGVNSVNTSTLNIPVFGEGVNTPATATTGVSSGISVTGASLSGETIKGCPEITARGFEYSIVAGFANGTGIQVVAAGAPSAGAFTAEITNLNACTIYYYKAFVTDATGTYFGDEQTFSTPQLATPPTANSATAITQTSFTANWNAVTGATGYYLDVSTNPDFETVFLSEDFSGFTAPGEGQTDTNIANPNTFNNYTQVPGWTGTNVYAENSSVRIATGSGTHSITTPTVNITGGTATFYVTAKHDVTSTSNKSIVIQHAANGTTFTTLQTIVLTDAFETYSIPVSGGTANSKFRIQTAATSLNRFQVDNIKIAGAPNFIAGYDGYDVTSGISHEVTALLSDTTYYYRVRAYGANCTTPNSTTITVETLKFLTLLSAADSLSYGTVCTNATETRSFTFSGSGMADATLTIAAVTGYTYSLTEEGTYTNTLTINNYNGAETTVWVMLTPAAPQSYNANIIILGTAPYASARLTVQAIGTGIFTPATATSAAATSITATSASISATSVTGNCTTNTEYGIEYSTVNNFANGSGTQLAGANIDETGAYTVVLENLLPCKTYYYKAYTKTSGSPVYSTIRSFTTSAIAVVEALDGTDISGTTFTANWETVNGATGYRLDVSTNPEFGTGNFGTDLIISEYIEGTSNNKALEIYNGTGAAVNLSGYSLRQQANGSGSFGSTAAYTFNFPAVSLPAGSTYVIKSNGAGDLDIAAGHPANLTSTLAYADANGGIVVHFTGNDAVGLFKGSTMIDVIGVVNNSSNWGADKTFRRKSTVLSPSATYTASQWDEFAQNNSGLGAHTFNGGLTPSFLPGYNNLAIPGGDVTSLEVTGLAPFTKYYYRLRAYSADCAGTANSDVIEVITRGTVTWKTVAGVNKWIPEFYADGTTPLVIDNTVDTAIEANYTLGAANNFNPKSITVSSGIFTVTSGNTFRVENDIVNNAGAANFVVENNANLIQGKEQNNNQGAITVNRNTSPLFRNDYVMWSSPVAGQGLVDFSPHTAEGRYYQYNPAGEGNGQYVDASGSFEGGKGYLIRMPNSAVYSSLNEQMQPVWLPTGAVAGTTQQYNNFTATMVFNGKFTGVPNNGDIPVTLSNAGHSYHLIGNPYPSPLNLPAFLSANSNVVTGTVYVWRKKNASNGTSAYITMNRTGQYTNNGEPNTTADPAGIIRTGQGFIVQMVEEPASNQVMFNNTMRSDDTSNQFFRNANPASQAPESHGVYLNLTNTDGVYSQMYTGYIEGATEGRDNGIDSEYINDKATVLSTVMAGKEFIIHGRALPFNSQNTEPLQLRVATEGQYKIAIDRTEGSFTTQDIYLQDNMLNITHNIKAGPYTFTTDAGTFANRFEIVYSPEGTLGTNKPVIDEGSVVIYKQDNVLKINSAKDDISSVTVYDIRGRKLYEATNVNSTSAQTTGLQSEQQVLIVKVKTANGAVVSKKVIF